jgi:hypothetical protein
MVPRQHLVYNTSIASRWCWKIGFTVAQNGPKNPLVTLISSSFSQ